MLTKTRRLIPVLLAGMLLVPLAGTLFPPLYNTQDPELFGVPFFYWYQMLWIPISVIVTLTVYRATRRKR